MEIGRVPPKRLLQVGDTVHVDLSGLALGYCERCEDEVLTLPEGDPEAPTWWCCSPGCGSRDVLRLRDITENDVDD